MYEIRQVRMPDGEVLYLLADTKTGLPDAHVIRYTFAAIRPTGASSSTLRSKLRGIRIGLTLMCDLNIDIEQRISSGRFLGLEELSRLRERCLTRSKGDGRITGQAASHYYWAFLDYVAFRVEEVLQYAPEHTHSTISEALVAFEKRAKRPRPKASDGVTLNERLGLRSHERDLLLKVIKPGDPGNPFQRALQVRNHAIVLLSYALGLRAGEEFALKRKDYDNRSNPATITIHRRPDDCDETRSDPALVKTFGRTLAIDEDLRKVLDDWLDERSDRGKYPNARKNPYIFVSRSGAPLSLRRGRQIYEQLRTKHPELAGLMQHVLRHDANDRWTEDDDRTGVDPEISRRERTYAFGWSDTSDMPNIYGKASIRRSTMKRLERVQREVVDKIDE